MKKEVNEAIDRAKSRVMRASVSNLAPAYLFANENLRDSMLRRCAGKDCLVVNGSGDYKLSALHYGVRRVDSFDINIVSKYLLDIKEQVILNFSLSEFLEFFHSEKSFFSADMCAQINKGLSKGAQMLCEMAQERPDRIFCSNTPRRKKVHISQQYDIKNIPYLQSQENYNSVKSRLSGTETKFYRKDATKIVRFIKNKKYDFVHLSNIVAYSDQIFPNSSDSLTEFYDKIIIPISGLLKDGGVLIGGYVYNSQNPYGIAYWGKINSAAERDRQFAGRPEMNYHEFHFPAARNNNAMDAMLAFTKKSKSF
ncbi:MAG: hypothetical protein LBD50_03345 [Rickettsiales bacterium]|jgi:hypothetical protein|nr:hypothetical protein [Rickettsiales bacterium]